MKHLLLIVFTAMQFTCLAQFDKPVSVRATANINVVRQGLATNDAGYGLGLDVAFFATHRLQAVIETSADWFVGDKLYVVDNTGTPAKRAAVHSVKLGPQFFAHKNLALSITYGPTWSVLRESEYTRSSGFKYGVTGFLGKNRKTIAKLFMVNVPLKEGKIQYFGFGAGFRF